MHWIFDFSCENTTEISNDMTTSWQDTFKSGNARVPINALQNRNLTKESTYQ